MSGSSRKLTIETDDVVRQQYVDDDLNASLEQGCLNLGDEPSGVDNNNVELRPRHRGRYVTRFRIDHEVQTSKLCSGVTLDELVPCYSCGDEDNKKEQQSVSMFWYLMSSELVIFTLHVSAVIFGVVKEALDLRHDDSTKGLHFAHSIVETTATFLVVVIQMMNTRMGYVKVRHAVERLEHFDPDKDANMRTIMTWMWSSVAAGFVLVGICVGCFISFYFFVHLGWTVLSNQICIILSLLIFGLYRSRVMAAVFTINMDQHKVVIHEALMLLRERCQATGEEAGGTDGSGSRSAALRFVDAVSNTTSLSRPNYINVTFTSQQHRH